MPEALMLPPATIQELKAAMCETLVVVNNNVEVSLPPGVEASFLGVYLVSFDPMGDWRRDGMWFETLAGALHFKKWAEDTGDLPNWRLHLWTWGVFYGYGGKFTRLNR